MRLENLSVTNFQSYANDSVDFGDGVTLIHGGNGAGKSTLLRAIFAGLYQADATTETSAEYDLVDLVRSTDDEVADEAAVELTFSIDGTEYTVEWELSVTEKDGEPKASTRSCVLTSDAYPDPVEGVTDVRETIEEDLLGMGATEFANSVYVQQKRLSRLINATERERKEILDSLLGFDQLDTYIERMKRARRPAKRARNDAQTRRQETQERIDEFEEAALRDQQQRQQQQVDHWEDKLAEVEDDIEAHQRKLDKLTGRIDEYEGIEQDIDDLEAEISDKESSIETLRSEIQSRCEKVETKRDRIADLEQDIEALEPDSDDYTFATAEAAQQAKVALDDEWEDAYEAEQAAKGTVTEHKNEVTRLEDEKADAEQAVDDAEQAVDDAQAAVDEAADTVDARQTAVDNALAKRDEAAAEFLGIAAADVTDDTRTDVEETVADADAEREQVGNTSSERRAEKSQLEDQHAALDDDVATAREEYETLAAKVDVDEDTDPQAEFDDAVEQAAALGDGFGITVDANNLHAVLRDRIPALRDDLSSDYHAVTDEWADAKADERYYERLLTTVDALPDGGAMPDIDTDSDHGEVPLDRAALAEELSRVQLDVNDADAERLDVEAQLDNLDTLATHVARALQLRALANTADEVESLEQKQADIAARIDDLEQEIEELSAKQAQLEDRVETGEAVLEQFEQVEDVRDTLADAQDEYEQAQADLDDAEANYEDAVAELERVEAELADARDQLGDARDTHADAEAQLEAIADLRADAEQAVDHYTSINTLENEVDTLQEGIGQRNKRIKDLEATIENLEADLADKRAQLGDYDLDDLREKRAQVKQNLDVLRDKKQEFKDNKQEAQRKLVDAENQLDTLEAERERAAALDERIEWTNDLVAELTDIIETYKSVKLNLRTQTLDLLNKYTNEVFNDLYQSESYVGIRIDGDYNIELVNSGGGTIDPDKCSGGEGVITNIALRAGVYRVISDQDADGGAGLPPFILDEPTNHLDSVHVSHIEDVIESVQDWDVSQVFVVSHRETLVENADHELYIETDPATDASVIHTGGAPDGAGGEGADDTGGDA